MRGCFLRGIRTRDDRSVQGVFRVDFADTNARAVGNGQVWKGDSPEIDSAAMRESMAKHEVFPPRPAHDTAWKAVRGLKKARPGFEGRRYRPADGGAGVFALGGFERHRASEDFKKMGQNQRIQPRPESADFVLEEKPVPDATQPGYVGVESGGGDVTVGNGRAGLEHERDGGRGRRRRREFRNVPEQLLRKRRGFGGDGQTRQGSDTKC
mmetsp:Transcript_5138/g.17135  ORF Transcript_5138/g.17135 Transcript_5138/m.17135 type:complete len:210 (-) Transcript_5138:488-1117(-)